MPLTTDERPPIGHPEPWRLRSHPARLQRPADEVRCGAESEPGGVDDQVVIVRIRSLGVKVASNKVRLTGALPVSWPSRLLAVNGGLAMTDGHHRPLRSPGAWERRQLHEVPPDRIGVDGASEVMSNNHAQSCTMTPAYLEPSRRKRSINRGALVCPLLDLGAVLKRSPDEQR